MKKAREKNRVHHLEGFRDVSASEYLYFIVMQLIHCLINVFATVWKHQIFSKSFCLMQFSQVVSNKFNKKKTVVTIPKPLAIFFFKPHTLTYPITLKLGLILWCGLLKRVIYGFVFTPPG